MQHDTTGAPIAPLLITFGGVLLCAALARPLSRLSRLPQVTLLILLGLAAGPLGLNALPEQHTEWYPALSEATLALVGFSLGGEFTLSALRARGRAVLWVSVLVTLCTFLCVLAGAWAAGVALPVALILGSAATATDPAACQSVAREGGADGPVTRLLLGVVAVDDLWGVMVFSGVMALLSGPEGGGLLSGLAEIGLSLALGALLGALLAVSVGWLKEEEPARAEVVGAVLLAAGLAHRYHLSYLLVAVAMGAAVANRSAARERALREVDPLEQLLLALFFTLSGASLNLSSARAALPLAGLYVGLRVLGRLLGAAASVRLTDVGTRRGAWLGLALLPQAGVALGMTLVASARAPEAGAQALAVVVLGTVLFEVVGPIFTRAALRRFGEL